MRKIPRIDDSRKREAKQKTAPFNGRGLFQHLSYSFFLWKTAPISAARRGPWSIMPRIKR